MVSLVLRRPQHAAVRTLAGLLPERRAAGRPLGPAAVRSRPTPARCRVGEQKGGRGAQPGALLPRRRRYRRQRRRCGRGPE
eukprot:8948608-Pyramimonas_sp.AAC.1